MEADRSFEEIKVGGSGADILIWPRAKNGVLSHSEAWKFICGDDPQQFLWTKWVWQPKQTPRYSFCCWQTFLNKLPTLDRLARKAEDIHHLLWGCSYSRFIWSWMMKSMTIKEEIPHHMDNIPVWTFKFLGEVMSLEGMRVD
ncbi:hypothetical protein QJS10_CPB22g00498 [Acorus calamus]|uniref:Reverse transcriptase zinc-binding domain-containing protein n=1 Tax=Acorus calamus TaxID=4465 RepID=A0AAV9C1K0_ACOCL|nr:hypothetical protein QJS10_CPB22g00498 [Acorus calamus]